MLLHWSPSLELLTDQSDQMNSGRSVDPLASRLFYGNRAEVEARSSSGRQEEGHQADRVTATVPDNAEEVLSNATESDGSNHEGDGPHVLGQNVPAPTVNSVNDVPITMSNIMPIIDRFASTFGQVLTVQMNQMEARLRSDFGNIVQRIENDFARKDEVASLRAQVQDLIKVNGPQTCPMEPFVNQKHHEPSLSASLPHTYQGNVCSCLLYTSPSPRDA